MKILSALLLGALLLALWSWNGGRGSSVGRESPQALHGEGESGPRGGQPAATPLPVAVRGFRLPGARNSLASSAESPSQKPASAVPGSVPRPEPGSFDGKLIREFFPDGKLLYEAEQHQIAGGSWELHGRWTAWHENGEMHERGEYDEQREHGLWEWWEPDGSLSARGEFVRGKREGQWDYWYEDGVKMVEANYLDGKGEGGWTLYHRNGLRRAQGDFVQGEISGYWTIWKEDGEVHGERTGYYEHGEFVSH